jgi:hypothetical protein
VPVSVGRAAAAESAGLHYYGETRAGREDPGDRERELLIARIDELRPEDRRHVTALVESLRTGGLVRPGGPLAPCGTGPSAAIGARAAAPGHQRTRAIMRSARKARSVRPATCVSMVRASR